VSNWVSPRGYSRSVLATAVPGFPVWDLAGPIGSTGWGVWVAALGVTILLRPATRPATAGPRS